MVEGDKVAERRLKNRMVKASLERYKDEGQRLTYIEDTSCTNGTGRERRKEELLMVPAPWHRLYLPHVQSPLEVNTQIVALS